MKVFSFKDSSLINIINVFKVEPALFSKYD